MQINQLQLRNKSLTSWLKSKTPVSVSTYKTLCS